jgi:hypothetical protein
MSGDSVPQMTILPPSGVTQSIDCLWNAGIAMFLWGPPGSAKSEVAKAAATARGVALIDLRLSQMDPSDLRGIPYPCVVGGVTGVRWSTPYVMPKDLDINFVTKVPQRKTKIFFGNPLGDNKIHYCTNPKIIVENAKEGDPKGRTVIVHETTLDSVTVTMVDAEGNPCKGKVRLIVTGETKGILALEEFNSAPPTVTAAAYQLVLDRRLGEYIVPAGVYIMGMGNRDTDKGVTFKMATPVANRYTHIEMATGAAAFPDWQTWALSKGKNGSVIGYLSTFKDKLFQFEASTASRGFATPRSWVFVADTIDANPDAPDEIMLAMICGQVGEGSGIEFDAYRKVAKNLPAPEKILSGELTKMPTNDPALVSSNGKVETSLAFTLTTTLCYELKTRLNQIKKAFGTEFKDTTEYTEWCAGANNFLTFLMENFEHEICVMGCRAAIKIHDLPINKRTAPVFTEFSRRYRDLIAMN